jgi:hypothetical protein
MRIIRWSLTALLLITLSVALTSRTATSAAQAETRLEQLQIDLWPEFDRPQMLIIYRGKLPAEVPLPATVTLRMPSRVGAPSAVAYSDGNGNLLKASYSLTTTDDWLLVSLETPAPSFQLEYYDDLPRAGDERDYAFHWPGDYAVDQLSLVFLPPPGASEVRSEPSLAPFQQNTGSTVYGADLGSTAAGEEFQVTIGYRGGIAGAGETPSLPPDENGDNSALIVAAASAVIATLALVIGGAVWYTRQSKTRPAEQPARQRRGARSNRRAPKPSAAQKKTVPAGFCTQCGRPLGAQDQFCGYCGTPVKAKTE